MLNPCRQCPVIELELSRAGNMRGHGGGFKRSDVNCIEGSRNLSTNACSLYSTLRLPVIRLLGNSWRIHDSNFCLHGPPGTP